MRAGAGAILVVAVGMLAVAVILVVVVAACMSAAAILVAAAVRISAAAAGVTSAADRRYHVRLRSQVRTAIEQRSTLLCVHTPANNSVGRKDASQVNRERNAQREREPKPQISRRAQHVELRRGRRRIAQQGRIARSE